MWFLVEMPRQSERGREDRVNRERKGDNQLLSLRRRCYPNYFIGQILYSIISLSIYIATCTHAEVKILRAARKTNFSTLTLQEKAKTRCA